MSPTPQILSELDAAVTNATTVAASASALIRGIAGRVQAAVDKAMQNGATAEELAPVKAEVDALNAGVKDLSDAITENTPSVEPPPPAQPA